MCITIIRVKTLVVYDMELNPYQWCKTRSALSWMLELVKNRKTKFDDVRKYLIEEEITYVEKFDGTNIGLSLIHI